MSLTSTRTLGAWGLTLVFDERVARTGRLIDGNR
jgi:hypothetical protein